MGTAEMRFYGGETCLWVSVFSGGVACHQQLWMQRRMHFTRLQHSIRATATNTLHSALQILAPTLSKRGAPNTNNLTLQWTHVKNAC